MSRLAIAATRNASFILGRRFLRTINSDVSTATSKTTKM
jgi:hypothetical protein